MGLLKGLWGFTLRVGFPQIFRLGFHPPLGWPKMLSFLSVCLSVMLLNDRVSADDFATKLLEYRNDFYALDRGRFIVVHLCSTFSDCRQLVTPQNAEVQKTRKIWGFFPPESNAINRSRKNLAARKHIP